jgi:DNA-binding NarL/FixJ family response regulator
MAARISVLIADDHAVIRDGLSGVLDGMDEIDVVATARDGAEAIAAAERFRPDVILMDIAMPEVNGVTATRRIVAAAPDARVVVLTAFADESTVLDAIDAGATGYLLKDADSSEVLRAIRAAARGDAPLDTRAARIVLRRSVPEGTAGAMTSREREVLELLGKGLGNRAIAERMGISESTVKAHLSRIYRHIGVSGRQEAMQWARARAGAR